MPLSGRWMRVQALLTAILLMTMSLLSVGSSALPPEACFGASEADLENGFVVVSGDGLAPDDLLNASDEEYTVWTPEQYLCVYPPVPEVPDAESVPDCLQENVLANITATPEEQAMLCSPVETEIVQPDVGGIGPMATTASAGVGSGWRHMGASYALKVNVVSPTWGNVPGDKCAWSDMDTGTNSLEGDLGHTINVYCYLFSSTSKNPDGTGRAWDSCYNPFGSYGCTQDSGKLLERLNWHVYNRIWSYDCSGCTTKRYYLADQVTEVAAAWVNTATNNGIAYTNGWSAIFAEHADDKWDWDPEHTIVKHELAHLLAAGHEPGDDSRLYVCNWPHWHGWYDHWHSTKSVMNYCWAGLHDYMGWEADADGLQTIRDNANDWTSCSSSPARRPFPNTCL